MSISDYIEQKAQAKKREVKYEIWKAKNHDSRMRAQGAILGTLVGAAAGLLLAPKSGKETREDIVDAFNDTVDTVKDGAINAVDSAKDGYEDLRYRAYTDLKPIKDGFEYGTEIVKETGSQIKDASKDAAENIKDGASDVKEIVKEGAKEAKEVAEETGKEVKEDAKDAADDTKKAAKEVKKEAKDTTKEVKREDEKAKKDIKKN